MTNFIQEKIVVQYKPHESPYKPYSANVWTFIFWGKLSWDSERLWGFGYTKEDAIADLKKKRGLQKSAKTYVENI